MLGKLVPKSLQQSAARCKVLGKFWKNQSEYLRKQNHYDAVNLFYKVPLWSGSWTRVLGLWTRRFNHLAIQNDCCRYLLIWQGTVLGGIRTHDTRIFRSAAIPNLATVPLLLVPLFNRWFVVNGSSVPDPRISHSKTALKWPCVIFVTVPNHPRAVGNPDDQHHLQVHHTPSGIENRGKKVADPDFYFWIRISFCFFSLWTSFSVKSSGKTTFRTGPKDSTRIRISVSSSRS